MDIIIVSILLFIIIGIIIALIFFYVDYTSFKDIITTKEKTFNAKFDNYSSTSNITSNILTAHMKSILNEINPKLLDANSNFISLNALSMDNSNNINNFTNNFDTMDSNLNNMFGINTDTNNNSRFPNEQIFKYNVTDNGDFNDFSLMKNTIINGGLTIKGLTKMCDLNDQNQENCFSFSNYNTNLNINSPDNNLYHLNINTKTKINNDLYSCDNMGNNCFSFSNYDTNLNINSAANNSSYLNINTKTKLNNELYSCDIYGNNCYIGSNINGTYSFNKKQPGGIENQIYSITENKLNINKDNLILNQENGVSFKIKKCDTITSNLCFE